MSSEDINNIKKAAQLILKNEIRHLQLVPAIAHKLLNLTSDDNTKIEDLTRIIETEPALTAKILQVANSAAYALPVKITSIHRAVNMLGFSAVRRIALTLMFYNRLINQRSSQTFDPLFFWQHCLFVAALSRKIAVALNHPDPDLVYTAGLLHDIGKMVLESHGRMTYSDFISSLNNTCNSTLDEERLFFGITHTEIGHMLCLEWQFPVSITAVIAYHHEPPPSASPYAEYKTEIAVISFANYVAWMQGIGSIRKISHPVLPKYVLDTLAVDQLDLEDLLEQVDQEMQNAREYYGIQFPSINTLRTNLVQTGINLSRIDHRHFQYAQYKVDNKNLSSLTVPHQSLEPDDFVPWTLEAIKRDFAFDQAIMFSVEPKRRSLIATHWHPESTCALESKPFEITIESVSGLLLTCLREKQAVVINAEKEPHNPLLQRLNVTEYLAVPVLHHRRIAGLLYADYSVTKKNMPDYLLAEITPIANELGIALFNARKYDMAKKHAQLDSLTQILNKRMLDHYLEKIFQQDKPNLARMAIGFVDIDRFKQFNDICGHQAGNDAIRIVADILKNLTRPGDILGRYGGEEFLFVLMNTDQAGALGFAERVRSEIERRGKATSLRFHDLALTVSIGIALYHPGYTGYADMIEVADQAMYQAKNEGRNRVILLPEAGSPE